MVINIAIIGLMEVNMKANGLMVNNMVKVGTLIRMEREDREYGKMARE